MHRELIEKAEKMLGSGNKVAKHLGVDEGHYRGYKRANHLPAWMADKLALLVGEDREEAMIESLLNSARSEPEKKHWAEKKKQLKGLAAALILAVGALAPQDGLAKHQEAEHNTTVYTLCVL